MKQVFFLFFLISFLSLDLKAQEIQTLFRGTQPSGGYGALSNKFTTIKGEYANLAEVYGGWFIKRKFLLGIGAAASTNNINVPTEFATTLNPMTWQYGQLGLMTEYVFKSNRVIHFNFTFFSGAGFTVQYQRDHHDRWRDNNEDINYDENFFYVIEPGAQVEVNVFKWLRLSPGVSYRKTLGSDGIGLKDGDLTDWSYNITLKVGKF